MNDQQRLISVESQTEYSVTSGATETRIFVKMYVDAAKAGLIASMGAQNWTTICVIASFMDAAGNCYPTQEQIARHLGVNRTTANRHVRNLVNYRWNGRPVIRAVRDRTEKGTWQNTRYTVLPISQLAIFDAEPVALGSG
ncbi:helix-turn-helix domain-containing protein [Paenibacillus sp. UASWS1643]|uniref:helix-turn-helix domain-containing protein n=1 Tax=Paenibacillus sp. UASWS1643 TaxID=2580422 RepID=UPI001238406E|nr:helix-turn-helix domain-containing protein [Paenibacillus sp. UASWS1643]KAA8750202.1 helix-turn-helix domain-containing protein [Paenibacillus sp. UASWS1643]